MSCLAIENKNWNNFEYWLSSVIYYLKSSESDQLEELVGNIFKQVTNMQVRK